MYREAELCSLNLDELKANLPYPGKVLLCVVGLFGLFYVLIPW